MVGWCSQHVALQSHSLVTARVPFYGHFHEKQSLAATIQHDLSVPAMTSPFSSTECTKTQ